MHACMHANRYHFGEPDVKLDQQQQQQCMHANRYHFGEPDVKLEQQQHACQAKGGAKICFSDTA